MKAKDVLKAVATAAAVASLVPFKVARDEETGTVEVRALLWGVRYAPKTADNNADVSIQIGLPTRRPPVVEDEPEYDHMITIDLDKVSRQNGDAEAAPDVKENAAPATASDLEDVAEPSAEPADAAPEEEAVSAEEPTDATEAEVTPEDFEEEESDDPEVPAEVPEAVDFDDAVPIVGGPESVADPV